MKAVFRLQPAYVAGGLLLLALTPFLLILMQTDARTVDGVGVWVKPLKFAFALGTYLLTLAALMHWVPKAVRGSRVQALAVAAVVLATAYEMGWLLSASAYGVRSHFNMDGSLFTILYPLAGVFAFVLVLGPLAMGTAILRAREKGPNPAMTEAVGCTSGVRVKVSATFWALTRVANSPPATPWLGTPLAVRVRSVSLQAHA